ncbi:unnamed protein product, partial [Mesorhabditis belari]|uniref:UBP-type domain-containing protein n=1 Tax=Mesorhabditis belari TaxID=2138241 RepID=A0AAF3EVG6_9BILA
MPRHSATFILVKDAAGFEIVDDYYLVIYPNTNVRVPIGKNLSPELQAICAKVIEMPSAERLEMLQNATNAWDGEMKQETKHANMKPIENGKIVPYSGWACEEAGCGLTENLWLNLIDGAIRCGRSQFISEGQKSKGNNHMKQYYDATGFPLVVKLGTIENETADVYSYDEDDAVIDPNLRSHLAHFGLDVDRLHKTEKSTLELELDMNQKCVTTKAAKA